MLYPRLVRLIAQMDVAVTWIAGVAAKLAAVGIFAIVVLLVASSLLRYVAGSPIAVTEELAALLFLGSAFLSLAFGFTEQRHVRLELFWKQLPSPWREIAEILGLLMAVVALGFLITVTWSLAVYSFEGASRSERTEILRWPWRVLSPCSLALFLAAVVVRVLARTVALIDARNAGATR